VASTLQAGGRPVPAAGRWRLGFWRPGPPRAARRLLAEQKHLELDALGPGTCPPVEPGSAFSARFAPRVRVA
jgi:hypothetical protein